MAAIAITAANVLPSTSNNTTISGVSGAAITAGQAVYQDVDLSYKPADADGASPLYKVVGIALNSTPGAGQPITICTNDDSFTLGGTVAAGDTVWLSPTAGGLTSTFADLVSATAYVQYIGSGIGSNKIKLKINRTDVLKA